MAGVSNPVKYVLALILLIMGMPALGAEARPACSGSAFLSSDYYWLGVPVMHNASQPVGDDKRCAYVVPVSVELAEQWHEKKLPEEGWQRTNREPTDRGVALEFRDAHRIVQIVITDIQFATVIVVKRPVFIVADH
jgi:hypothetical protein